MTIKDRLLQMRSEIDALIAELPGEQPAPTARFMSVPDFAELRGYSDRTIREYCELGMPHSGKGKSRRVIVADAIAWIDAGGPKEARMGRKGRAA